VGVKLGPHGKGGKRPVLLDYYDNGRRVIRTFPGTVSEAKAWLAKKLYERDRVPWGVASDKTWPAVAAEFLAAKRNARTSGYTDELERVLVRVLGKRWQQKLIAKITPDDVEGYLAARQDDDASPRTRAKELVMIGTLFRWAMKRRYISANPLDSVDKPRVNVEPPRWLRPGEYAKLYDAAPDYLKPILDCLVVTGLRAGELCRLDADQIKGDTAYVTGRKTAARSWLPIIVGQTLGISLREAIANHTGGGLIFQRPSIYKGRVKQTDAWTPDSLRRAIQTAARHAGLDGVKTHALRHTCASWLAAAGVSPWMIREVLGHAGLAMTEKYAHLGLSRLADEFPELPESTQHMLRENLSIFLLCSPSRAFLKLPGTAPGSVVESGLTAADSGRYERKERAS
jgi:integrase